MVKNQKKKKQKNVILPPELPPEVSEDEIEVSDEDLEFVKENRDYVSYVSRLDTDAITKHVTRAADLEGAELEAAYEKRLRKKSLKKQEEEKQQQLEVDPVDALPVKTLDGQLHYRTLSKKSSENGEHGDDEKDDSGADKGIVKMTKSERRAKLKKSKKEAKKLGKELDKTELQKTPQAAVLAEVQEDLTAEEVFAKKKSKLAELGIALLADPESNIKSLKEMLEFCRDADPAVVKLGLLSLLAVFKDIIPGYRIRLPTEKEQEMKVSKEVKKMRYYESTLLSVYKGYLQKLIILEKQSNFRHIAVRCICTLLEAVPHFNFRENLLAAVVEHIGSSDDVIRKLCCASIKSLFTNEGKHGGHATVEAAQLIANHVKTHNCQLHPDSIEVYLSLSFDEDLGKQEREEKENKVKNKKNKKRKNVEEPNQLLVNDRKKSRKELMSKMREEVTSDIMAAGFAPDVKEQRRMQSDTLSSVFETYFRILKHTMQSIASSSEASGNVDSNIPVAYPLLAPCLNGLGKFSHLIDLDYIGDLMNYLKRLAGGDSNPNSPQKCLNCLTVTERLQCCIVAFKVMKINLDALNVDLQGFFVLLYNLILEYRPGRDRGEVLAEALKIMLCEDRQHDMQKAAAFAKRLASFSLCFGSAECMAALVTVKFLLQKNVKCRNLLENDAGGGSVSGSIAKYQPYAEDPNLSGALASVLWELNLLFKHYHPAVSTMASSILSLSASHNQLYLPSATPQQAFASHSLERELLNLKFDIKKSSKKRKRVSSKAKIPEKTPEDIDPINEEELRKKLSDHFNVLHDLKETQRSRGELEHTKLALQLYDEYNKKRKRKSRKA